MAKTGVNTATAAKNHQSGRSSLQENIIWIQKHNQKSLQQENRDIVLLFDESSSKSITAEGCQFNASQLTSHLFNSHETSNELLPSKSVCISQYDDTYANVKVDDSNSYSLSGENLSLCNAASPQTNSPKLINSVSEEIMVDTKAIPSLLIPHGECKIPQNVHLDNSKKNSLGLHFDYEEHSSDDAFVPSSINGESARTIGSTMKREFALRVQISKSS
ncbi:hypothetical protein KSP40_PGU001063 [Platanthera guangdongensis]|uniref:Uncharacterized protein n=1 Tax=Platanthera guangdongensis TaxID=2320717 RepID=A0ABR2MHR4_9ASPA